jgi:hypothetical protein
MIKDWKRKENTNPKQTHSRTDREETIKRKLLVKRLEEKKTRKVNKH